MKTHRVLAVAMALSLSAAARAAADGSLDSTFGRGGEVNAPLVNGEGEGAFAVAIQRDGKIVAGGSGGCAAVGCVSHLTLARYNSNGSLDATFGTGGKVLTNVRGSGLFQFASSLALQGDGKIVAAGGAGHIALARYLSTPLPLIGINSIQVPEGNSGQLGTPFTVTLSKPSTHTVTAHYATVDGSATVANNDYVAASGTLTFAPGVTSQRLTILHVGDTRIEPNEAFKVVLSSPVNAALDLLHTVGVATLLNDDGPVLKINDVTVTQGSTGSSIANFTVTLSQASTTTVTVNFATRDGSATVADRDYVARSGTLTFNPGETSKAISVTVNAAATPETAEFFYVLLSDARNASILDDTGVGTIVSGTR